MDALPAAADAPVPAHPYAQPVASLLTLGECREPASGRSSPRPDYAALGLGPSHVPELIRMGTDEALYFTPSDGPEPWAPIHAWRALGALRAAEAVPALLPILDMEDWADSDWPAEELPEVFAEIGAPAVPALAGFLHDEDHGLYARTSAASALEQLAARWGGEEPAMREACVAALTRTLEKFAINPQELNGFLVSDLTKLRARGALPLIERAFAADVVDPSIHGDWEDVQVEFGLKAARDTPRPNYVLERLKQTSPSAAEVLQRLAFPTALPLRPGSGHAPGAGKGSKKSKAKNRKKAARQARKRNRRR